MHTPVNKFHENHHHLAYDARTNRQKNEDTVNIKKEKLWFMLVKIVSCLNSCNGCYRKIINYNLQNIFSKKQTIYVKFLTKLYEKYFVIWLSS